MGDAVGLLRIEVSDTGVGISSEGQRKLFGEFVQFNKNELQGGGKRQLSLLSHLFPAADGTIAVGGSGLGLWISRRIVQMHNVCYIIFIQLLHLKQCFLVLFFF